MFLATKLCSCNIISLRKEPGLLGDIAVSRVGQEVFKIFMGHLAILLQKPCLKNGEVNLKRLPLAKNGKVEFQ